ncbi:MAG: 3-dehydroquinate synthase [Candidatus Woesearchaeota archaeon]
MKTIKIKISSKEKGYNVLIGRNILHELKNFIEKNHKGKKIVIITDDNVNKLHGEKLLLLLSDILPFNSISSSFLLDCHLSNDLSDDNTPFLVSIPPGEKSKSREQKQEIEDLMLEEGFGRNTLLIAFGGGVVGDLAGFIASTFNRGIPFIQIPTTLLAMVDSSIGGKTGINTKHGKNLIGTFYQPELVIADIDFLDTLSDVEFRNGMAEVVKIAAALDEELFGLLENNMEILLSKIGGEKYSVDQKEILVNIISKSIQLKADIVEKDEKESGLRQVLNLGHTVGHAIETVANFQEKHGFAIATGMVVESKISEIMELLDPEQQKRITDLLERLGLTINIADNIDPYNLIELMRSDKKNTYNKPKIVLLEKIGLVKNKDNEFSSEIDDKIMKKAIDMSIKKGNNVISNDIFEIKPIIQLNAEITVPGSKYVANRVLMIAALADGVSILKNVPDNDDINKAIIALKQLGVGINRDGDKLMITGTKGEIKLEENKSNIEINVGESGTLLRFITGLASLAKTQLISQTKSDLANAGIKITGSNRIQERPIAPLLDALEQLGVKIDKLNSSNIGCCPIVVKGLSENTFNCSENKICLKNGTVIIDAGLSSQFLSSLLLIAPCIASNIQNDVEIITKGEVVSKSYVNLTISLMEKFGVKVERDESFVNNEGRACERFIIKAGQKFNAMEFTVPGDWSSANYFLAAAAIVPGRVKINDVDINSVHGEAKFADVLEKMGCKVERVMLEDDSLGSIFLDGIVKGTETANTSNGLKGIDIDMSSMPDSAQTLAVVALFADGQTRIRNIANLSLKESDRINDTVAELKKFSAFGADVSAAEDGIIISKGIDYNDHIIDGEINKNENQAAIIIDSHNDHRMAMSLALIGLKINNVKIMNPNCVSKSFPGFWKKLEEIGMEIVK